MTQAGQTPQRILMMVADGFDEAPATAFQRTMNKAGIHVDLAAPEKGLAQGWHDGVWGHHFLIENSLDDIEVGRYDAVYIPGGSRSVQTLSDAPKTVDLLARFAADGKKVIAAGDARSLIDRAGIEATTAENGDADYEVAPGHALIVASTAESANSLRWLAAA